MFLKKLFGGGKQQSPPDPHPKAQTGQVYACEVINCTGKTRFRRWFCPLHACFVRRRWSLRLKNLYESQGVTQEAVDRLEHEMIVDVNLFLHPGPAGRKVVELYFSGY